MAHMVKNLPARQEIYLLFVILWFTYTHPPHNNQPNASGPSFSLNEAIHSVKVRGVLGWRNATTGHEKSV